MFGKKYLKSMVKNVPSTDEFIVFSKPWYLYCVMMLNTGENGTHADPPM
jgi:hypothetical protein